MSAKTIRLIGVDVKHKPAKAPLQLMSTDNYPREEYECHFQSQLRHQQNVKFEMEEGNEMALSFFSFLWKWGCVHGWYLLEAG